MDGKNRLLALGVGTILAFLAQLMFCLAEHTGLIECAADVEEHQSANSSEQQSHALCCATHSHAVIAAGAVGATAGAVVGKIFLRPEATAPDGPVRDIDYPPQLS